MTKDKEEKVEKAPTKAELAQQEADAVDWTDEVYYPSQNEDGTWNPWDPTGVPTISRAAAVILGFRRYFTGEPCKNGHIAPRKVKGSTCVECNRIRLKERMQKRRAEDPEFRKAQNAKAAAKRKKKAA